MHSCIPTTSRRHVHRGKRRVTSRYVNSAHPRKRPPGRPASDCRRSLLLADGLGPREEVRTAPLDPDMASSRPDPGVDPADPDPDVVGAAPEVL